MDGLQSVKVKQLAGLLAGLDRTFRDDFKRSNRIPSNLTLAQYQVISMVADRGQCSQKKIAADLNVTGPTVVRIIDALETKKLVRRTRDVRDRRIVLVSLTEKGMLTQRECAAIHEERLASMMERLPTRTFDSLLDSLSALLGAVPARTG